MTTELMDAPAVINGHDHDAPGLRTFRGRTLEELLPQIREALGPDAVVVRQRDGLMGGVGGFFQQRFVEVEARPGGPRVDVYDEEPAVEPAVVAFARQLAEAEEQAVEAADEPAARKAPASKPVRRKAAPARLDVQQLALAVELVERGFSMPFAEALVADATAHLLPFAEGDVRAATRTALARRIPVAPVPPAGARTVAFAGAGGAGKTRCAAGLAAAHAPAGAPVACFSLGAPDGGAELTRRLAPHGLDAQPLQTATAARTALRAAPPEALAILDTPAVSPGDPAAIAALAKRLAALRPDEVHLVVPATLSAAAARELHERLAALKPTAIVLAHADATGHLGSAIELACATGLPLSFVAAGAAEGFAPADPQRLAERLLP